VEHKLKLVETGDRQMFRRFLKDRSGATAIEYGLIAALIALAIMGSIGFTGDSLGDRWNRNAEEIAKWLRGEGGS
jgi:pilus assembly protein Flp/PilA